MSKPASREIISASVELCETDDCFLHSQQNGTNVRLPNMHKSPCEVDFESSRSLENQSPETVPQPALLCSVSHMTILFEFTRVVHVRDQNVLNVCHSSGPFGDSTCKFAHRP